MHGQAGVHRQHSCLHIPSKLRVRSHSTAHNRLHRRPNWQYAGLHIGLS